MATIQKNQEELRALAQERFGELGVAFTKLLDAVAAGEECNFSKRDEEENSLKNAESWSETRTLNAEHIAWLCTDKAAKELVTHKGVRIFGVKVEGKIELESAEIPFMLAICFSSIPDGIWLERAKLQFISLQGSHISDILASSVKIEDSCFLAKGFVATGVSSFRGASIGGDFNCQGAEFNNETGDALTADGITVTGCVCLSEGFKSFGEVRLPGASIGGELHCEGGEFHNENGDALNLDGIVVEGNVYLKEEFKAFGKTRIKGAKIFGDLDCSAGAFINKSDDALDSDGIVVGGDVLFKKGFQSLGTVSMRGARISGVLNCIEGEFDNPGKIAMNANRLKVDGSILFYKIKNVKGSILLDNSTIGGDLSGTGGTFENIYNKSDDKKHNYDGVTLRVIGTHIKNRVLLRENFSSNGKVFFRGGTIGGNVILGDATFNRDNDDEDVILFDSTQIEGNVYFDIEKNDGKTSKVKGGIAIVNSTIKGALHLRKIEKGDGYKLDLSHTTVGTLYDEKGSWPDEGSLSLDGFSYSRIHHAAPLDWQRRKNWLDCQGKERYFPQPYEQLALTLKKMGHNKDAREIQIEKERVRSRHEKSLLSKVKFRRLRAAKHWVKHFLLNHFISYGYVPWKAFYWALLPIIVGAFLFECGHRSGLMAPCEYWAWKPYELQRSEEAAPKDGEPITYEWAGPCVMPLRNEYPTFSALLYSLDVFVPVMDFHAEKYWLPNPNRGCICFSLGSYEVKTGGFLLFFLWVEIICGWVLSTLFIAGLTGLVRRE